MFTYNGRIEKVTLATTQANSIIFNTEFHQDIIREKPFHDSNITNAKLVKLINKHKIEDVEVRVYKKWWKRFSSELAYFSANDPFTLNINYYKLKGRSAHSVVGSIIHEWVHAIDALYDDYEFEM